MTATATPLGAVGAVERSSRTALRAGAALLLAGGAAEFAVTSLHAHREPPNDHSAAFAEYAASENWIAVHLGQFAAGLVLLVGILVLLAGLRGGGAPSPVVRAAEALTAIAGAVFAVLQAVDGVALKHVVDSLVAAPSDLRAAAFHDAETVRWTEWALAGYFRITLGLAVIALALAVLTSRALPRWTAAVVLVAGGAFVADGVGVGYDGFTGATLPNLISWAALAVFALAAAVAALRGQYSRSVGPSPNL